jgi:DNA-binding MarR family transcriptional regulator
MVSDKRTISWLSVYMLEARWHLSSMQDFVKQLGRPFVASALKRVAEQFQAGAVQWYAECGITAPVKTASAVLLLNAEGPLSIMDIAARLRQSHPTTIEWMKALESNKLVRFAADPSDRRRNIVSLTGAGRKEAKRISAAQDVFRDAYAELCAEIGDDIYSSVLRLEEACDRRTMFSRLRDASQPDSKKGP